MRLTPDDVSALAADARDIVASNKYLTLSTADASGSPWVTPVYFTPDADGRFLWVSSPTARHSTNLAARPDVAFVIFDSTVAIGAGRAFYASGQAALVPSEEIDDVTAVFTARFDELAGLEPVELRPPGPLRMYRATISEASVLLRGGDPRNTGGIDTRVVVEWSGPG